MKIVSNHTLIKRNKRIGQIAFFASLALIIGGLYMLLNQLNFILTLVILVLGLTATQLAHFYENRYGRSPRPDEMISQSLKGLDSKYKLYHYSSPVPHLLLGPAGVWIIAPYTQAGTITYDEKKRRWNQKGGNLYLKIFGQESLGRPDLDIKNMQDSLQREFKKRYGEDAPTFNTLMVMLNDRAVVDAENAPVPTLSYKKLKDFFRRQVKENPVNMEWIDRIENDLPEE